MPRTTTRLAIALALVASLLGTSTAAQAASLEVTRIAGTDRYQTAVEISKVSWPAGAVVAFVSTGLNYADSVAVTAAGGEFGPVLLTHTDNLPAVTEAEIKRLEPDVVFILGGPRAISDQVQFDIAKALSGTEVAVSRIAGTDRYETAVEISRELRPDATLVYLADGHDYAAGITAAAAAGINGGVLLTTPPGELPDAVANELARINPATLIAVGDLSADVVAQASAFATEVGWIQGTNGVKLSADISTSTWESAPDVIIASAADFPDALASAAWAVQAHAPLLLTDPAKLDSTTACEILRLRASGAVITGGPRAITSTVERSLADISPRVHGCRDPFLVQIPDPLPSTEEVEVALFDLVTSPDGTRAYVINNEWNSIEVIDVEDGNWVGRIAVGSDPTDLGMTVDGKKLYVANSGSQTISVVDLTKPLNQAEKAQVPLFDSGSDNDEDPGAPALRSLALEVAADGAVFVATNNGDLQMMNATDTAMLMVDDPEAPKGVRNTFHSVDNKIIGMIGGAQSVTEEPTEEPTEGATAEPTEEPTEEGPAAGGGGLFTYADGEWKLIGTWGEGQSEVAYGLVTQQGVSASGGGNTVVFSATVPYTVLGTVHGTAGGYGLAVAPEQASCPKTRGNPAVCQSLAYNVLPGEGGGVVEVMDITVGTNVDGSFRVIDRIPLQSVIAGYGEQGLTNQAVITADARSLVIASQLTVEIIPIG